MKRLLVFLFIFTFNFIFIASCFAAMKLYTSSDCENCDLVMEVGKEAIQQLEDKNELEVIDVTDIGTDLPALPALVDGEKVIIGTGLLRYLSNKAEIKLSPDDEQKLMLDDCPDCQE